MYFQIVAKISRVISSHVFIPLSQPAQIILKVYLQVGLSCTPASVNLTSLKLAV